MAEEDQRHGAHSIGKDLVVSERRHRALSTVLNRRGIADVDPETREGRLINGLIQDFMKSADQHIPETTRALLAETLVSWILINRSAMTHFLHARRPSEAPTESGKAKRQALQLSINTMAKATG